MSVCPTEPRTVPITGEGQVRVEAKGKELVAPAARHSAVAMPYRVWASIGTVSENGTPYTWHGFLQFVSLHPSLGFNKPVAKQLLTCEKTSTERVTGMDPT